MKDPSDPSKITKVLQLCKFTMSEKYEKVYSLLYYKTNMLLIIQFPSESSNEEYLDAFQTAMEFYQDKRVRVSQTKVTDEQKVSKRLKFLFRYNKKLKFDFLFSDLLVSHLDVNLNCPFVFFFEERKNPLKNVDPKEELRKKELREKEERERALRAEDSDFEEEEEGGEGGVDGGNMIGKDEGLENFDVEEEGGTDTADEEGLSLVYVGVVYSERLVY